MPSLLCFSSGFSVLQSGNWAIGQRVWKWQPDGGWIGLGTSPCKADALALRPSGRESAPPRAAPGVGVQRRACRARCAGAISTMRPRYITATRVLMCSHHREVVGDEQVGEAELLLQVFEQVDDLRLDRDVERRDRLVADDQLRDRPPARGRCRCAGAGRPRTRADSGACGRPAGRPSRSSSTMRASLGAALGRACG